MLSKYPKLKDIKECVKYIIKHDDEYLSRLKHTAKNTIEEFHKIKDINERKQFDIVDKITENIKSTIFNVMKEMVGKIVEAICIDIEIHNISEYESKDRIKEKYIRIYSVYKYICDSKTDDTRKEAMKEFIRARFQSNDSYKISINAYDLINAMEDFKQGND